MKVLPPLFLAVCLCVSLFGCGSLAPDPVTPPTNSLPTTAPTIGTQTPFTLPYFPDESFHPTIVTNKTNLTLSSLMYEPLYQLDANFQPIPCLASGHTVSQDASIWTITLKSGVTFWDGTPLTADIVASALREAMGANSQFRTRLSGISSISSLDNQIIISLSSSNIHFLSLLHVPISYGGGELPQGTGGYYYDANTQTLRQNANWHQGDVAHTVLLYPIERSDDLTSSFDSGVISFLNTDLTDSFSLSYATKHEVASYATPAFTFLGVNHNRVTSASLRTALNQSLDRVSLCKTTFAGYATPTISPVHPDSPLYDSTLDPWLDYDQATASEVLAPFAGRSLSLLVVEENTEKMQLATQIANHFAQFDIIINLNPQPWNEYQSVLSSGNFDLYLGEVLMTPDFNMSNLVHSQGALNYSRYYSANTDYLLALWLSGGLIEGSPSSLLSNLVEQVPIIPICFKDGTILSQWGSVISPTPVYQNPFYLFQQWEIRQ